MHLFILCVSNPIGGPANLNRICRGVKLFHSGYCFYGDFYVLGFDAFDLLLGNDWLGRHNAHISCKARSIYLADDLDNSFVIQCRIS